jgi:hypothetical protein
MYCWNCGRENPDDNAYCGACGKKLVRSTDSADATAAMDDRTPVIERHPVSQQPPVQANPLLEEARVVRESVVTEPSSVYAERRLPRNAAPSMYGLNDDAVDDSDYLLDEEEPRSAWRGVLGVVLVALIALLIYKQWDVISASTRNVAQRAGVVKNEAPAQPNSANQSATDQAAGGQTAPTNPDSNVTSGDITVNSDRTTTATPPPADTPLSNEDPAKSAAPTPAAPATNEEEQLDQARSAASNPPPTAGQDNSQVELAQKYLQGRGVAQDCARGVSLLRSAAGKGNAKAQIQLGALYATGHCVTQDKAAAYRWFAQAQDLEPNNGYVSRNLNSLWSSMTAEERQRAESR